MTPLAPSFLASRGLRPRDLLLAAGALVAFWFEGDVRAWTGAGPRAVVVLGAWLLLAGMPASGAPIAPVTRLLGVLAVGLPGLALALGRDLAEGESARPLTLGLLGALVVLWTLATEAARRERIGAGLLAAGWLLCLAGPALMGSLLLQVAPETWRASSLLRLVESASPVHFARSVASSTPLAGGLLPLALSVGVLALVLWRAREARG